MKYSTYTDIVPQTSTPPPYKTESQVIEEDLQEEASKYSNPFVPGPLKLIAGGILLYFILRNP